MRKFLIIQTAFIGDVVLATALAEKLNIYYPNDQIDFLVRKGNESLLDGHPFIKKVWVWDKKKNKIWNLIKLAIQLRSEAYDEVINVQRFFSSGLVTLLVGAKNTRGFSTNPLSFFFRMVKPHSIRVDGKLHEVGRNQQLIRDITDEQSAQPRLYPSPADEEKVSHLAKQPYICCAPGSVWFTKRYPIAHWITFLEKIPQDIHVHFIGAKTDTGLVDQLIEASGNKKAKNWCGKLSYLESAALMRKADMNFVNDSAPLHFASATNAPVTAIFCSTVPAFGFGPLSDKSILIETPEKLQCRPCGIHGWKKCPLKHFKCAYTILPERLVAIVNER